MCNKKKAKFGGSLPVPCVQELANNSMLAIPPRYIRPGQDLTTISDNNLDSRLLQSLFSEESTDSELSRLHFASKEWASFQVNSFAKLLLFCF